MPAMTPVRLRTLTPLWVTLLTLSGCGGGHDSAPDPLTGTLEAGKALGVQYDTPTQSGTTDANGTFSYLPGETVTFSIGGVQLGAVPGAVKISLFTLAGLTPPSSEITLRRELERAQRRPTPLVRAMNLARLLIALDADNNPDNGIDVSGRAADLAGKQIDLGLGLFAFSAKLDRLAPNLTRNIPTGRTLVFAYQASNLTVASHNPVRHDVDGGQFWPSSSTITYLANGARSREESSSAGLGLGTSITTYSYDALGRWLDVSTETPLDPLRLADAHRSTNTYDARGNRVKSEVELYLFDSLNYRSSSSGAADIHGLFPELTYTLDNDGDGIVDFRQTVQTTFDARGNPVASTISIDDDNDGVIDTRYSNTAIFDAYDRLQAEISDSDTNADGVVDTRAFTTVANDGPSAVVRTVTQDYGVDGVIDDRSTSRWKYDAAGNNTSVTILDESLPDNTVYSYAEFTMTYDGDHRVLSRTRAQAFEVGGAPYSTDSSTNVYDGRGNLTHVTAEYSNLFGSGAARTTADFEYGPNGERTMFRYGTDYDADGVVDYENTTQVTNQEFSDGVLALAQQYFDFATLNSADYVGGVAGGVTGVFAGN